MITEPTKQSINELRKILERIHGREFSFDEAAAIGKWWLGYVSKLIDEKPKSKHTKML